MEEFTEINVCIAVCWAVLHESASVYLLPVWQWGIDIRLVYYCSTGLACGFVAHFNAALFKTKEMF